MIKKLIARLLLLSDSGSLLKRPIKGLYSFFAILCFLPLAAALVLVFKEWDSFVTLLGRGFWSNFVSMFILDLILLSLVMFGLLGFHFWKNRREHLDKAIRTGSRTVAIPLVADINQSLGEVNSLFLAVVPVTLAVLAYVACMLTGGLDFYHDLNFLLWLLAIVAGAVILVLVAYVNLLLTRFFSERIRLIPSIGNDVQRIANGTSGTVTDESENGDVEFKFPEITGKDKACAVWAVAGAALCSLLFALWIAISVGVNYKKSVFVELTDAQVERVANVYPGFESLYDSAREMAEQATENGQAGTYRKVTYKMLADFYESFYNNDGFREKAAKAAGDSYEKNVHAPMVPKVDAEKEKWQKYLEEHDVDKYLSIETVTSYYKESSYYYEYDRPAFYFKLSEPKGKLSDAEVVFVPQDSNGYTHSRASATTVSLSTLKDMDSSSPRHYTGVDDSSFWDKYTMKVTVNSVTLSGGKTISSSDKDKVPQAVKDYLDDPSEYNETVLIKSQIDPEYKDLGEYVAEYVNSELSKKNPLCYEFITKFD